MEITYSNGKVFSSKGLKGFDLKYKGQIEIINSSDNLFINANKNRIIGIMLNAEDTPNELFEYKGNFKIISFLGYDSNSKIFPDNIEAIGLDYWNLDKENWEDDSVIWGEGNETYMVDSKKYFDKKNIVVNNNLKVSSENLYRYSDGSLVPENTDIHIYNDGTIMTGAKYNEQSQQIYPYKQQARVEKMQRKVVTLKNSRKNKRIY